MIRNLTARLALAACLGPLPAAALAGATGIDTAAVALSNEPQASPQYKSFDDPSVSDEGIVAALADVKDGNKKRCIVLFGTSNGDTTLICTGDPAPADTGSLEIKGFEQVKIAQDSRFVSWVGLLAGGLRGVFTTEYDATSDTVGLTKTHVLKGDAIESISGVVSNIIGGGVNGNGDVYFSATLSLDPPDPSLNGVVAKCAASDNCRTAPGEWTVIAQEGGSVPDNGSIKFCAFDGPIAVSNGGVTFKAFASDECSDDTTWLPGVYRKRIGSTGPFETLGRRNEPSNPSPTPPGTQYSGFKGAPAMNDDGGACFIASTKGVIEKYWTFCCDASSCPSAALPTAALGDMSQSLQGDAIRSFTDLDVSNGGYLVVQTAKGAFGVTNAFSTPSSAFTVLAKGDKGVPYAGDAAREYEAMTFKSGIGIAPGAADGSSCYVASHGNAKSDNGSTVVKPKSRKALYQSNDTDAGRCP